MFTALGSISHKIFYTCMQNEQTRILYKGNFDFHSQIRDMVQFVSLQVPRRSHTFAMTASLCAAAYVKRAWRQYWIFTTLYHSHMSTSRHAQIYPLPRALCLWIFEVLIVALSYIACFCCLLPNTWSTKVRNLQRSLPMQQLKALHHMIASSGYSHKWTTVVDQQFLAVTTIAQCDITGLRVQGLSARAKL